MNEPDRWRDERAGASSEARALLRAARRARPLSEPERARSAMRVDRLAALPVAAGVWVWWKGVALAAAALTGAALVTQLVPALPKAPAPPPPAAPALSAARPPSASEKSGLA